MVRWFSQRNRDRVLVSSLVLAWAGVWFELSDDAGLRLMEFAFLCSFACWRKPAEPSLWLWAVGGVFALNMAWLLLQGLLTEQMVRAPVFILWLSAFLYAHAIAFRIDNVPWFWFIITILGLKAVAICLSIWLGYNDFPYIGEGYWDNQNYAALWLGGALAALWGYGLQQRLSFPRKQALIGVMVLLFLALMQTGSRGALLALTGCVLLSVLRKDRRLLFAVLATIGALGLIIALFHPDLLHYWLARADTFRLQIWRDSFAIWQQAPWLGTGWRSEPVIMLPDGNVAQHPHNQLLGALYYGGLPALIGMLALLVLCGIRLWSSHYLPMQLLFVFGLALGMIDSGWWLRLFHSEWLVLWVPIAWAISRGHHAHRA